MSFAIEALEQELHEEIKKRITEAAQYERHIFCKTCGYPDIHHSEDGKCFFGAGYGHWTTRSKGNR